MEHWASPAEITGLCQRELLLRILVRSTRLDPTASIWPETPSEAEGLFDLDASARAAAASWRTNQAIAATGPGRTTDHLDPDRIRAHLADRWTLTAPVETADLTAAARDRGILGADAAICQARPFYLKARSTAAA